MLTELFSAAATNMTEPMTAVIVINGVTLIGVIRTFAKLGRMEKMFELMWADYVRRKKLD